MGLVGAVMMWVGLQGTVVATMMRVLLLWPAALSPQAAGARLRRGGRGGQEHFIR